jgi:HEAT repeat protein
MGSEEAADERAARARQRDAVVAGHQGDVEAARALAGDADAGVRERALGALARAGALTDADLAGAAADPEPRVRRRTAELIAAGHGDRRPLVTLLEDPDATVVEVAAWAAGERPDVAPLPRLVALATGHDDPLVREAAVAALGAVGDPDGLPAVLQATTDKATVRRRAVIALAAFEGPEVDAALEAAREDRDWQVRQVAEDLLGPGREDG